MHDILQKSKYKKYEKRNIYPHIKEFDLKYEKAAFNYYANLILINSKN